MTDKDEEQKHILGYTKPKGRNMTRYKIYDEEGYKKWGIKNVSHFIPTCEVFDYGLKVKPKKVVISFE
jgi:hypothetical protein